MCGRYSLTTPLDALRQLFRFDEKINLAPRYNIAPSQPVAVIAEGKEGKRHLTHMQWGLVPSWAKDPSIGHKMINARAETAAEKPSFRNAWKRRRCLIPADGFYEWRKLNGGKQPCRIAFGDDRPFAFAGLYEDWMDAEGTELTSCTILTTEASEFLAPVHHRMPVILPPETYSAWLDRREVFGGDILRPFEDPELICYPVSSRVNKPANDDATLWQRVEEAAQQTPAEPVQQSLF